MITTRQELAHIFERAMENLRSGTVGTVATLGILFLIHLAAAPLLLVFLGSHSVAPALFGEGRVLATLEAGTSSDRLEELDNIVRSWIEVAGTVVIPGEKSRAQTAERLGRRGGDLLEGLDAGAFPPSIEITTRPVPLPPEAMGRLEEKLRTIPEITRVVSSRNWVEELGEFPGVLKTALKWALAALVAAAVLLVFLSVRHTIASRREETAISRALGASAFFTTSPFYLEGSFIGVAASIPASLLTLAGAHVLARVLPAPWTTLVPWGPKEIFETVLLVAFSGVFVGALGSLLAVRLCDERHLPDVP